MRTVAIMANGPLDHIPDLKQYEGDIDKWIGADRGALTLAEHGITIDYVVGDFDSTNVKQKETIRDKIIHFDLYPEEKDATDLEIALQKALNIKPEIIYLFGVTGGRLDHALINMQMLRVVVDKNIRGIIVDKWNQLELTKPGTHTVTRSERYPYISFVPFTEHVRNLTLTNFYYSLQAYHISWGSTRCISNKLIAQEGTFTYEEGMLMLIKSCDAEKR